MSGASSTPSRKRKAANTQPQNESSSSRKRLKYQEAHSIETQSADEALSKAGELNITSFIKSREYEIKKLDESIKKSKQGLSTRAFQQVPRHLRRRTASHNAKKVPRRLRSRARREMIEDNTPTVNSKTRTPTSRLRLRLETAKTLKRLTQKRKTVRQKEREAKSNAMLSDPSKNVDKVRIPRLKKDKLAKPPMATSKFKRRQISKSWLPTHLWHAKRAHMTRPTEPLWRMAIPLRPTEKCYRATHRATGTRGCVAWDMSYISTVSCLGTEKALEGLLKALKFHGNGWNGSRYVKWRSGSRFASGWICAENGESALGVIDVIWCASKTEAQNEPILPARNGSIDIEVTGGASRASRKPPRLDRKIMIRIHPSAFHQFWQVLLQIAKLQKPQVIVEDLRFEIGSIETIGPESIEALIGVLELMDPDNDIQKTWAALSSLPNPALLPMNAMLHCEIEDPRLRSSAGTSRPRDCEQSVTMLHDTILDWPLDASVKVSTLFSHKARHSASNLPSQWALNRRRQTTAPGQKLQPNANDPKIPIILLAHRSMSSRPMQQGTWTLLAPWKCIDVIWRKLLLLPLSSGRKPRFGGLYEKKQMAFEQSLPWFPGDYPGTDAGKTWERSQSEQRFDQWIRRPPSRRIAWESLDLGLNRKGELGCGWMCDWEYLFKDSCGTSRSSTPKNIAGSDTTKVVDSITQPHLTQRQRKAAVAANEIQKKVGDSGRNTSSPEADDANDPMLTQAFEYIQLTPSMAKALLQDASSKTITPKPALFSVRITVITRGSPLEAARIYRLPSMADLRHRWLALDHPVPTRDLARYVKKEKPNHRGLPREAQFLPIESLRHINVLPKNPPQEIIDQYGPKPLTEEERKALLETELAVHLEQQKIWDVHVPCPDATDLIGFVTTGGYNLAEGNGTAIGSIWLQRLVQGWAADGDSSDNHGTVSDPSKKRPINKQRHENNQRREHQRHLCIVRNAGESIGRLATWALHECN